VRAGEATARPLPLHVTNGDSAGNTLRQTALGGAVLPWRDVLHEGPVPAGPRRELLQARAAFVSACGWGSKPSILASLERRDRRLVQALRDGQQVVLWFEHDLYDQLPPPPPLGDARAFARLPLRLTGLGERVLDGREDRVALMGLDRWLGGTHLTAAAAWRWDPAAGLLVRPLPERPDATTPADVSGAG
jgi:hypothetical protein